METLPAPSLHPEPSDETEPGEPSEYGAFVRSLIGAQTDPAIRQARFLERAQLGEPQLTEHILDSLPPYQRLELADGVIGTLKGKTLLDRAPNTLPASGRWQGQLAFDLLTYFGRSLRLYPEPGDLLSPKESARLVIAEYLDSIPDHPILRQTAQRRFLSLLDDLAQIDEWWYGPNDRH
ncbi:hypothetical protein HY375_01200 [Candidatus Berkelbacteria bacterium]|nr:hypothetical protein [Candidatus Berkelbacteria bacterium]